jgi:hypothetical protein
MEAEGKRRKAEIIWLLALQATNYERRDLRKDSLKLPVRTRISQDFRIFRICGSI